MKIIILLITLLILTGCQNPPIIPDTSYCEIYANSTEITIELMGNTKYYHFENITISAEKLFNDCLSKEKL